MRALSRSPLKASVCLGLVGIFSVLPVATPLALGVFSCLSLSSSIVISLRAKRAGGHKQRARPARCRTRTAPRADGESKAT
jgi:hypothetical protein